MKRTRLLSVLYLLAVGLLFAAFAVVFLTFPRSKVSELERRELAEFPTFSWEKLASGEFTKQVSAWFSDSEPYRDVLMMLSMKFDKALALSLSEADDITFHASADGATAAPGADGAATGEIADYENKLTRDENAKVANAGIIVVGSGPEARALMAYGGSAKGGTEYARAANEYKRAFGPGANVYCMVIPIASEFYCPEKVRSRTNPQLPTIRNIHAHLDPGVRPVDVYTPLGRHAAEPIYLRTDHHWAPLGAFYAAEAFAKVAGVPFRGLDSYERKVVRGYVGSMYGYSKDITIKNAPEDFVYYVPRGVDYQTTYVNYTIDRDYRVTAMSRPQQGPFFYHYKDGSGGAYCTFMGSDTRITCVRTSTPGGRRVLILKDSFGNALPGFLFFSFEEVHVVDNRYFTLNMKKYVRDHHITDILFAQNIMSAYSSGIAQKYVRYLTQGDGSRDPAAKPGSDKRHEARKQGEDGKKPAPAEKKPSTSEKKPASEKASGAETEPKAAATKQQSAAADSTAH